MSGAASLIAATAPPLSAVPGGALAARGRGRPQARPAAGAPSLRSSIEPLEARIAPASLLDPRTVGYTDADGDLVRVVFSRDVFTGTAAEQLAKANEVFKFSSGDVGADATAPQQLQLIDLTKFPVSATAGSSVNGVGLTHTATLAGTGDGLADVGLIKAAGVALGRMVIDGDLGKILAGTATKTVGLSALTVNSLGLRGVATQLAVPTPTTENPAPDIISVVIGEVTALNILTDLRDAKVSVIDGRNAGSQVTAPAKIGTLTVGGSILGRSQVEAASDDTGVIESQRDIGVVKIAGNIVGGGGADSGRVSAGTSISSFTVTGALRGGAGAESGVIAAGGNIGTAVLTGGIEGAGGEGSGTLRVFGRITALTLQDDLTAGAGARSGAVQVLGSITRLSITGDVDASTANAGAGSANIFANGLPSVTLTGGIIGGALENSGVIESGRDLGTVLIAGSIIGGDGAASGALIADGAATKITVKGHVSGGDGRGSGVVRSGLDPFQLGLRGDLGALIVQGTIIGGGGHGSGAVISGGNLRAVTVGSAVTATGDALAGGAGDLSGTISASGLLGVVKITGDIQGGGGRRSGAILSYDRVDFGGEFAGRITSIAINGQLAGGAGIESGGVFADGALGSLSALVLYGGQGNGSGTVRTGGGLVAEGHAGSIQFRGGIEGTSALGAGSASVLVEGKLGSLTVGSLADATVRAGLNVGALSVAGSVVNSTVSAFGQAVQSAKADVAFGRITVTESVRGSAFLAGYAFDGTAANPDAQIGSVIVKGAWIASDLVAGAVVGSDPGFGNPGDAGAPGEGSAAIVSKIASIVIGGVVSGSGVAGEAFGFVAQHVAKLKVGTTVFALNRLADQQTFSVGAADSGVFVREIA